MEAAINPDPVKALLSVQARGDINNAILSVRIEQALYSGLQMLVFAGGYLFKPEEKALWKSVVDELCFSPLVYLP